MDILILRSEQFGPFELDDALLARDYKKAVQVIGTMLDEGVEPLMVLSRIVRVWRQLFVGKSLVGKRSAKDVAAAAGAPVWKAAEFAASCKKFEWKQLAAGFRLLLNADRAFKTSTPNPEGLFRRDALEIDRIVDVVYDRVISLIPDKARGHRPRLQ